MERYIGQSLFPLKKIISEHKGYIYSIFPTQATGDNFNLPVHSMTNVTVTIIENNECYKKERETTHIRKFNSNKLAITQFLANCFYML